MHENDTGRANLRSVALSALRGGLDAGPHLERLLKLSPAGSDDAIFARRHLAELCVEHDPWRCALHLRELERLGLGDEVLYALGGLAHALLGNFRVAATRYRDALRESPRNPWYHHNLGHLLDSGLGESSRALGHLRIAHGLEPDEPEIAASLANCLRRLGCVEEAREVARESLHLVQEQTEHARILREIASAQWTKPSADDLETDFFFDEVFDTGIHVQVEGRADGGSVDAVSRILRLKMNEAGFGQTEIEVAHALWEEYAMQTLVRLQKPEVMAAAVEYTFSRHELRSGPKRAEVARRYGVSTSSIASRSTEIRDYLGLV